ncbi:M48 family metallopeptidase [Pseudomonas cichorii]|uniref:tetratricopeptide repeat protein n=1 Tax=Pseudomonas cichorii TaxID=36746 RepID=UPI001C8A40C0|nr:tetratricopeptide repeat protein [Pseudomonas cichorii]MBX8488212.1 tetratricopeptide repeat protein [Pseudomonas cichorii]
MFNKYLVMTVLLSQMVQPCLADTGVLDINGPEGNSLLFKNFDNKYGGWSEVEYKSPAGGFSVYALPSKNAPSEDGVVANSDVDTVSPDKKYAVIQRTNAGEVIDEEGNNIISEQAYCDLISLESGCVKNIGSALQCDGVWVGQKWKVAVGESYDFSRIGNTPKKLLSEVSSIPSGVSRASSLKDMVFMGVPSYMACYPPEEYIAEYNDIGFYFAEGGDDLLAMQIYTKLLSLAPDRVPLKLNVADSLWALGKQDESRKYYFSYHDLMIKKGMLAKVPKRVEERLK